MIHNNFAFTKSKGIKGVLQDLATAILDAVQIKDMSFFVCPGTPSTWLPNSAGCGDLVRFTWVSEVLRSFINLNKEN